MCNILLDIIGKFFIILKLNMLYVLKIEKEIKSLL